MSKLQSKYNKFHKTIKISQQDDEYKKAKEKDDLILSKIKIAFKEEGYPVKSNFRVGSFAVGSAIKSICDDHSDIDRAIVISEEDSPEDPLAPKKVIKSVLKKHGFKTPLIKKPCVTADYESKPIHLDYTVYKKLSWCGGYELAIGKEQSNEDNKYWDESEPKELLEWINNNVNHKSFLFDLTNDEYDQFIRIIRYLKRWRDFTYTNEKDRALVYSIGLTIMAREQFVPHIGDDGANDNKAFEDTIRNILNEGPYFISKGDDKYDLEVMLPVSPYREVFQNHGVTVGTKLYKQFSKLLNKLEKVEETRSLKKQCEILRDLLGDDFPEEDVSSKASSESAGYVGTTNVA